MSLLIEAVDACFRYGQAFSLGPVSIKIHAGEILVVTGENGSGKTTLLRLLGGVLTPTSGSIGGPAYSLAGGPAPRRVSFVPQKEVAPAGFLVGEVVSWGRLAAGPGVSQSGPVAIADAIALVGLSGLERNDVAKLSGGQYQRVTLARALASGAEVVLMDEPSANIDAESTERVATVLQTIASQGGAVVVASHDSRLITALGRDPLQMASGQLL